MKKTKFNEGREIRCTEKKGSGHRQRVIIKERLDVFKRLKKGALIKKLYNYTYDFIIQFRVGLEYLFYADESMMTAISHAR